MAATAILGEEAWARMADRNDERIPWALAAMQSELGRERAHRQATRAGSPTVSGAPMTEWGA